MTRIAPAEPPFETSIASALERIMPPGMEPLLLFRVMARSPRVFSKLFAGGLLDKGPLSLRQRELVIDRTTARLGCEYEWGVHVALFGARAALDERQIRATVQAPADEPCWSADESALLALVDELVDHHQIGEATWSRLAAHFDAPQILEAIALVGYYHSISFLCNGLRLPLESHARRFPERDDLSDRGGGSPASTHEHLATVEWTRDGASFTDRRYSRAHRWSFDGGASVAASSSPKVVRPPMSDPTAVDPEEAYVAALSSCHMLWFLDLAAQAGHVVERYTDRATGYGQRDANGKEWVAVVVLSPTIDFCGQAPTAHAIQELHHRAHEACFLANSVKTEVRVRGA